MEHRQVSQVISAIVPLAEMFGLPRRSVEHAGRAEYSMHFARMKKHRRSVPEENYCQGAGHGEVN